MCVDIYICIDCIDIILIMTESNQKESKSDERTSDEQKNNDIKSSDLINISEIDELMRVPSFGDLNRISLPRVSSFLSFGSIPSMPSLSVVDNISISNILLSSTDRNSNNNFRFSLNSDNSNNSNEFSNNYLKFISPNNINYNELMTQVITPQTTQNQNNIIVFNGIYRGINKSHTIYILVESKVVHFVNKQILGFNKSFTFNGSLLFKEESLLQTVESNLKITKLQNGWNYGGIYLPFNAFCNFKYDISANKIIDIEPLVFSGQINNINNKGAIWITSNVYTKVQEYHNIDTNAIGPIIFYESNIIDLFNNPNTNIKQTYLEHDSWAFAQAFHSTFKKYDFVSFSLKLSTKTNPRTNDIKRNVFVQSWGLKHFNLNNNNYNDFDSPII